MAKIWVHRIGWDWNTGTDHTVDSLSLFYIQELLNWIRVKDNISVGIPEKAKPNLYNIWRRMKVTTN